MLLNIQNCATARRPWGTIAQEPGVSSGLQRFLGGIAAGLRGYFAWLRHEGESWVPDARVSRALGFRVEAQHLSPAMPPVSWAPPAILSKPLQKLISIPARLESDLGYSERAL